MATALKSLLNYIREEEKVTKMELEAHPVQSRGGLEMRIKQAHETLTGLYGQYANVVGSASVGLYLTGNSEFQAEYARLADEMGAVVVSATEFYEELAKDAAASMKLSGRITPTEVSHILNALREVALKTLLIDSFERPSFFHMLSSYIPPAELPKYIKEAVVAADGHRMAAIYLGKIAAKKALNKSYNKEVLAVVVTGADDSEKASFAASGVFTAAPSNNVALHEHPDAAFVSSTLELATGLAPGTFGVPGTATIEVAAPVSEQAASPEVSKKHKKK